MPWILPMTNLTQCWVAHIRFMASRPTLVAGYATVLPFSSLQRAKPVKFFTRLHARINVRFSWKEVPAIVWTVVTTMKPGVHVRLRVAVLGIVQAQGIAAMKTAGIPRGITLQAIASLVTRLSRLALLCDPLTFEQNCIVA